MAETPDCVFCSIALGVEPSRQVMDNPLAIAFLDINPAADGHTLVAPRDHITDIFALNGEVAAAVWALTLDAARRLDSVLRPDGMTMFQANREAGWQDIFHFHIHLVPRWNGDPLVRPWRHASGDPRRLDALADQLRDR